MTDLDRVAGVNRSESWRATDSIRPGPDTNSVDRAAELTAYTNE
jgi:hypothetical protein